MPTSDRADREFAGVRVSTVDWPILVIDFPERRVPDAALLGVFEQLESFMKDAAASREKLFTVTDLTRMRELAPASQRRITAEWSHRVSGLLAVAALGTAHVTPSPILRGIITAVFWIRPTPRPSYFVATRREAMLKGIALYEASRIPLPPRLLAFHDGPGPRDAV